jgi:ubiquinone/menaquinone biosynthesis C-methylase UbiE
MVNPTGGTGFYDAWQGEAHTRMFGAWDHAPVSRLMKFCDQFNDFHMYRDVVGRSECRTLLDVGCATGRFFRYFQKTWPGMSYRGIDISESAIEYASSTFPLGNFQTFNGDLTTVNGMESDLVFCRDVIHHQTDPRKFLTDLYRISQKYLVIRMRTRESGETVFEPTQSCQYTNENWVPYIVFNRQELTDFISSFSPAPKRIDIVRSPMVLGGQSERYLPRELYDPKTGGSETSLLIEKWTDSSAEETIVSVSASVETAGHERPGWVRFLARAARKFGA